MNQNEFREFANNHGANFPGWMKWITELPNREDAVQAYRSMFANISVDDAFSATTAMVSERIAKPIAYEDVMPALAQYARRRSTERNSAAKPKLARREVFYCGPCRDTGWIEVFHPRTVRQAKEGKFDEWQMHLEQQAERSRCIYEDENAGLAEILKVAANDNAKPFYGFKDWRSVMIHCQCDAGNELAIKSDSPAVRFWNRQHVHVDPQKSMSQLIDDMKAVEGKPKNYIDDFDEFNEGTVIKELAYEQ